MTVKLLLYGASNPDPIKLVAVINGVRPTWDLVGILDDRSELLGSEVLGVPVLGGREHLAELDLEPLRFANNVAASTGARRRVTELLTTSGCRFATLVHPSVDVAYASVGVGTTIAAGVALGARVIIGSHSVLRHHAVVSHDVVLEDHVFLGPAVVLGGRVKVGSGAFVGAGAIVLQDLVLGAGSVVAAGATVIRDVPAGGFVAGLPARPSRDSAPDTAR